VNASRREKRHPVQELVAGSGAGDCTERTTDQANGCATSGRRMVPPRCTDGSIVYDDDNTFTCTYLNMPLNRTPSPAWRRSPLRQPWGPPGTLSLVGHLL
jgi:hypothetical protein